MSAPGNGPGPDQPTQARGWLARRTLRGRLIAGLLALLAVACAAVGLVTYVALHGALLNQLDSQLRAASLRYEMCLHAPPPGGDADADHRLPPMHTPESCAQQQAGETFSAQIRNGVLADNYVANGQCHLSTSDEAILTAMPADGQPFTGDLSSL